MSNVQLEEFANTFPCATRRKTAGKLREASNKLDHCGLVTEELHGGPDHPSSSARTSLLTANPAFMAVACESRCTGTFAAAAVFCGL